MLPAARGQVLNLLAASQVWEETGFDLSGRLRAEDCIEVHLKEQRTKLFMVRGVAESSAFAPLVRGEIGGFAWHALSELPATKEAAMLNLQDAHGNRHRFFNVSPTAVT